MDATSCRRVWNISDEKLKCSHGIYETSVLKPYGYDYLQKNKSTDKEEKGLKEGFGHAYGYGHGFGAFKYEHYSHFQPHEYDDHHLYDFNSLKYAVPADSHDILKISSLHDQDGSQDSRLICKHGSCERRAEEKGSGKEELSLSLSLHHPSSQKSNNTSYSTSEISEAISSNSKSHFRDYTGSPSGTGRYNNNINLDLSIALCGT